MTQKTVIRVFLLGLPGGLIGLGVIAVILYYHPIKWRPARVARSAVPAGALKRAISERDLREYVGVLSGAIGARPEDDAEKLRQTANWIESTCGPLNMGFEVRSEEFTVAGRRFRNLRVDIGGRSRRGEIVVVAAHYDSRPGSPGADNNATGVAAAMSLANALAGAEPERTIRFAWWAAHAREAAGATVEESGGRAFLAACAARGENIGALIQLHGLGLFAAQPERPPALPAGIDAKFSSPPGTFIALSGMEAHAAFVERCARTMRAHSAVPVESLALAIRTARPAGTDPWRRPDGAEAVTSEWLPVEFGPPAVLISDCGAWRRPADPAADTADRIDFARFAEVVRGIEAVIRDLAGE